MNSKVDFVAAVRARCASDGRTGDAKGAESVNIARSGVQVNFAPVLVKKERLQAE
jgi:hypothetical protein